MTDAADNDLPRLNASDARKSSRMRFSLGAIMFLVTATSLALGLIRAIPIPEEFRWALLAFGVVWGLAGLIAVGPAWMRFAELRVRMRERDAKLRAWVTEKQRAMKESETPDL
jgi:hypothetical protein